jgi:L-arabinonolactonase
MNAELLLDTRHTLGEAANWCHVTQTLFWTDIEGARLWRHDPASGATDSWPMPERLATFGLCEDPRFLLLGLASRLAFFVFGTGRIIPVAAVEPGMRTRLNDGRCDRQGRFVFGMKSESQPLAAEGGFWRLDADLSLHRLPLPAVAIANSISFSPDGKTMYYCDSPDREIRCCDYGAGGAVSGERIFVRLGNADGEPDGSTVDADGGLWNARWGGARVVRYGPDGVETQHIAVPTAQPSCVAFGGPALDTVYVTSARESMDAGALAGDPHAGGIFHVRPGRRGLPEARFAGSPARD